jgi:hypothetical protein
MVSQMFVYFPVAFRGTIQVVYVPGWPHKAKVVFLKSSKTIESFQFTVDKRSGSNVHKQKIIQGGLGPTENSPNANFSKFWETFVVLITLRWGESHSALTEYWQRLAAQWLSLFLKDFYTLPVDPLCVLFFKGGWTRALYLVSQKMHKNIKL